MTHVHEWGYVRQTLREARLTEPAEDVPRKLQIVREAAEHDYPAADPDAMEEEITRGYRGDE